MVKQLSPGPPTNDNNLNLDFNSFSLTLEFIDYNNVLGLLTTHHAPGLIIIRLHVILILSLQNMCLTHF